LRVIHGRDEHPSGAAPPGNPARPCHFFKLTHY